MGKSSALVALTLLLMSIAGCTNTKKAADTTAAKDNIGIHTFSPSSPSQLNPQSDSLSFLEAAGQKLSNLNSLQMECRFHQYKLNPSTGIYTKKMHWQQQIQYTADLNGSSASLFSGTSVDEIYLYGNTGYSFWSNIPVKHISDKPFTRAEHFQIMNRFFPLDNTNLFEDFCALTPTVNAAKDGSVTFVAENITYEQLNKIIPVKGNQLDSGLFPELHYNNKAATLTLTVDSQGYLSSIEFFFLESSGMEFAFLRFNQEMDIPVSDYETGFNNNANDGYFVAHHFIDNCQALYRYDPKSHALFLDMLWENLIDDYDSHISTFIPLSEIVGITVQSVRFANSLYTKTIEKLVIPKGVILDKQLAWFSFYQESDEISVFFEDSHKTVGTHFDNIDNFHVYFAGEWEYVDGIPQPIQ